MYQEGLSKSEIARQLEVSVATVLRALRATQTPSRPHEPRGPRQEAGRLARIHAEREKGKTYSQIAAEWGLTKQRIHQIVKRTTRGSVDRSG
jgi:predicted transcriptional regulator